MLLQLSSVGTVETGESNLQFATYLAFYEPSFLQNHVTQVRPSPVYSDPISCDYLAEEDFGDDFIYRVEDYSNQIILDYLREAEREAARIRKRLFRRMIRSTAVSMAGHLSFLVPIY